MAKGISCELRIKNDFRKVLSSVFRESFTKLGDHGGLVCTNLVLPALLECE